MPYQIQLILDPDYIYKKNSWFYSLYYDIKYIFVKHNNQLECININTVNTDYEVIYETFQYLVSHKYGGLYMDRFIDKFDQFDSALETFIGNVLIEYDDNGKDLDENTYMNSKLIEFLTTQTHSIDAIYKTCMLYCDNTFNMDWNIQFEFTE